MYGTKIKKYINSRGITQSYIAKKAGISVSVFSAMLNNKRKITIEEYVTICKALDVNASYFFD